MAKPLTQSTAMAVVGLGRLVERRVEAALGALGLTLRLVGALGHLAADPDLSYSDLARRAGVTPQSMRATVAQLEGLGAVRVHTAGQGVAAHLELTPAGRQLLDRARAAVADLDDELLGDLPPEVVEAIRSTMLAIATAGPRGAGPTGAG